MPKLIGLNDPKYFGILRCSVCGSEKPRVPAGLNYGFPKCHGQVMRVVTVRELQEEKEFYETVEQEEKFMRSTD